MAQSMRFGLVFDDRFGRHETGLGHPERPERFEAIRAGLTAAGLLNPSELPSGVQLIPPVAATDAEILTVHTPTYLERLKSACASGAAYIDTPDSTIGRESLEVARLAAGAVISAARRMGRGEITRAFCAVRPPGHHAERDQSMGFCLLANVALAVETLRREHGLTRIAVIDWDVHHGNGTQHIFEADDQVFFVSLHGHPRYLYPGTGFEDEIGTGPGRGHTLNIPLLPGTDDASYRRVFADRVIPAIDTYRPELIVVSAGFDAHADDPLGNLRLGDATFDWLTGQICELADRHCAGRILSVLEGGYDLGVLRRCVSDHARVLFTR